LRTTKKEILISSQKIKRKRMTMESTMGKIHPTLKKKSKKNAKNDWKT
jgi:hypothetical protein